MLSKDGPKLLSLDVRGILDLDGATLGYDVSSSIGTFGLSEARALVKMMRMIFGNMENDKCTFHHCSSSATSCAKRAFSADMVRMGYRNGIGKRGVYKKIRYAIMSLCFHLLSRFRASGPRDM